MDSQEFKTKFSEVEAKVSFWASTHGKATAVIIAVVVGLLMGHFLWK